MISFFVVLFFYKCEKPQKTCSPASCTYMLCKLNIVYWVVFSSELQVPSVHISGTIYLQLTRALCFIPCNLKVLNSGGGKFSRSEY